MIIKTKETEHSPLKKEDVTILDGLVKLDRDNFICLAACPGMGKTSFALHMALEYAKRSDKTVYIFTLEMSAEQIYNRMICILAEIDASSMRTDTLTDEQRKSADAAAQYLKSLNIIIDDELRINVSQIKERLNAVSDLGLVIIDYVALISPEIITDNYKKELTDIVASLSYIAKDKSIPLVAIDQVNRNVEYRKDKRPRLSDTRAGAEHFANTVIFIYREGCYECNVSDCSESEIAEIIVAKNRFDKTAAVPLEWQGRYTKFSEGYKINKNT